MDTLSWVIVAGAALAGFVQGLTGFAYGLTAMAFWAWFLEPHLAAVLVVAGSLTGQLINALSVQRGFNARLLGPFLLGGLAGLPLGVWVLPMLDAALFNAGLGLFLLCWCPAMLLSGRLPVLRGGGPLGDGLAGSLGGFMGGMGGFTGVIPTLWCTLRGLPKDEQRALIQNFNLVMLLVTLLSYLLSGIVTRTMIPPLLLVVGAMLVPTWIGARLYDSRSEQAYRRLVLGLLTFSGVFMLLSAAPQVLARM